MATNPRAGLTRPQLENLVVRLDPEGAPVAAGLQRLRKDLERFFAGKGGSWPDELVDRTVDILAQKLFAGAPIGSPTGLAIGIARRVLLEDRRKQRRAPLPLDETREIKTVAFEVEDSTGPLHPRLRCMKHCLRQVKGSALFLEYHRRDVADIAAHRERLARREHLSQGGLRKRVYTIRQTLQRRMMSCEHSAASTTKKSLRRLQ